MEPCTGPHYKGLVRLCINLTSIESIELGCMIRLHICNFHPNPHPTTPPTPAPAPTPTQTRAPTPTPSPTPTAATATAAATASATATAAATATATTTTTATSAAAAAACCYCTRRRYSCKPVEQERGCCFVPNRQKNNNPRHPHCYRPQL